VTRRTAQDRYLHLLAFIAHQTFKLQDTLVETLLQAVQNALNTTRREHKGNCQDWRHSTESSPFNWYPEWLTNADELSFLPFSRDFETYRKDRSRLWRLSLFDLSPQV
ncbi:MAG: hypothetical protein JOZ45_19160, partial [Acidobacteriaceae bacterium]|nr:hypothetical protein [Acidobacteriaceae bacterium]